VCDVSYRYRYRSRYGIKNNTATDIEAVIDIQIYIYKEDIKIMDSIV